jgi:hypothetical protein
MKNFEELNARVDGLFKISGVSRFDELLRVTYAGELYGEATFSAFAQAAENAVERTFWEKMVKLEQVTTVPLLAYMRRRKTVLPEPAAYLEEGVWTANFFSGGTVSDYIRWVQPTVEKALSGFHEMARLSDDPEGSSVCGQVVEHEIAFARCAENVLRGFDLMASCEPVDRYLEKYSGPGI